MLNNVCPWVPGNNNNDLFANHEHRSVIGKTSVEIRLRSLSTREVGVPEQWVALASRTCYFCAASADHWQSKRCGGVWSVNIFYDIRPFLELDWTKVVSPGVPWPSMGAE